MWFSECYKYIYCYKYNWSLLTLYNELIVEISYILLLREYCKFLILNLEITPHIKKKNYKVYVHINYNHHTNQDIIVSKNISNSIRTIYYVALCWKSWLFIPIFTLRASFILPTHKLIWDWRMSNCCKYVRPDNLVFSHRLHEKHGKKYHPFFRLVRFRRTLQSSG